MIDPPSGIRGRSLLHGEQQSFDVDVEDPIELFLGDFAHRREFRDAGIRKHDVELPFSRLDLREQAIEVGELGDVALNAGDVAADLFLRRIEFCWRRPVMKTYAPSATNRFAVASPMPLLPPVTSATLPSSFPLIVIAP